jgi:hypothetical protein
MLEYETINDRMCNLRMIGRNRNVTIISVHVTKEEKKKGRKKSSVNIWRDPTRNFRSAV